jgi:APA family basic amino acid/polyamine antiporter
LQQPLLQVLLGFAPSNFGVFGILASASVVFFAFIGFDVVATAAEETRNPQRDMPRGIFGALGIVTVLYVLVTVVVTGMVPYNQLGPLLPDGTHDGEQATLASAFTELGVDWAAKVIAIGALAGLTTVVMVLLLGQSRVIFAMSRDGLLPRGLATVNPRTRTPVRITVGVGIVVAVVAGFVSTGDLEEMVNVGTLFAFVLVSIGVIILRKRRPDLPRAYKVPFMPVVPILSVLACIWLMLNLITFTWIRFAIWLAVGLAIYFGYGRSHSMLSRRGAGAFALTEDELKGARRGATGDPYPAEDEDPPAGAAAPGPPRS